MINFPRCLTILLLMLCIAPGCRDEYFFEFSHTLNDDQWTYEDTLDFSFTITDTSSLYHLYLDVTHAREYPYQNIYLQVYTRFPSAKRIKELLPINFADKTGRWYGHCNSDWCQLRVHLQRDAYFDQMGPYTITLEQYMRIDSLPGIRQMALRLEETGRKR